MRERLGKKVFLRPKCEHCGERLYKIHGPFVEYFWGKVPSHCPKCGERISLDKKNHLIAHDGLLWLILCISAITFMIVLLMIVLSL
jgi:hypothetical protein